MQARTTEPSVLSYLRELFARNSDVLFLHMTLRDADEEIPVVLLFCEGMIDRNKIDLTVLPQLEQVTARDLCERNVRNVLFQDVRMDKPHLLDAVFSGQVLILFEQADLLYSLDISNPPKRNTEESNTEVSVKGPRDGFTEELTTNVALIRKRLRTNTLYSELYRIGRRSRTQVALLYIQDIANPDMIQAVRQRLDKINRLQRKAGLCRGVSHAGKVRSGRRRNADRIWNAAVPPQAMMSKTNIRIITDRCMTDWMSLFMMKPLSFEISQRTSGMAGLFVEARIFCRQIKPRIYPRLWDIEG